MFILGLLITSCDNSTEPTNSIKQVEYTPKISEAQELSQSLVVESVKATAESMLGKTLLNTEAPLAKTNDTRSYYYFDNWHVWRGDIEYALFDIPDSYNAEYLAKLQFLNNGQPQQFAEGATRMNMYLNAHMAFGFVNNEPYGDEVWYDFEGMVSPLNGWPSIINAGGEYERRWVGQLDDVDTELHYSVMVGMNNLEFYYDWNINDYYLNGIVTVYGNGFKILIRFTNSRTALMETYQGETLVSTQQITLPNYYEQMNIPSLENWNFGADFIFPTPIAF